MSIGRVGAYVMVSLGFWCSLAGGQTVDPNQFGILDRADAAKQLLILATQQGISSLPPTSGQSFTYSFSSELSTWVASDRPGPISFRDALTLGHNNFSIRGAVSYFELNDSLGPIVYQRDNVGDVSAFGLDIDASVGVFNFGFDYGLFNRVELMVNFPLVVNDANASDLYVTATAICPNNGPPCPVVGTTNPQQLRANLASGSQRIQKTSFTNRELLTINPALKGRIKDGTKAGLGRVDMGAKGVLYAGDRAQAALSFEIFAPSPNEDEYAGSDSVSILPRIITAIDAAEHLRFHIDLGYEYDFDFSELRRVTWNTGASMPWNIVTFDVGFGGSKFDEGVQWTPPRAVFLNRQGQLESISAIEGTRLGSNFVDFLAGMKLRLDDFIAFGASMNVPINNDGLRADIVGTVALEFYLR